MEPSPETFREIGRLCAAWAYLEAVSEITLWGILKISEELGETFTWRQGMRERWQMIVREAKKRPSNGDYETLKSISKLVSGAIRDRNIVIHGVIHAIVEVQGERPPPGTALPGGLNPDVKFNRVPCWTIYIGEDAGKNFPLSTQAVAIIRENIGKITDQVMDFNKSHSYTEHTNPKETVEAGWPTPL